MPSTFGGYFVAAVELSKLILIAVVPSHISSFMLCRYNPKRFSAAIIRLRDPKTTALIFASGKMVARFVSSILVSILTAHSRL